MRSAFLGGVFMACSTFTLFASAAEPFVAASGLDGAGLGMDEGPNGRAWVDVPTYVDFDEGVLMTPVVGAGVSVTKALEIEAAVPTVFTAGNGDSEFVLGNPYLGANFLYFTDDFRLRGGLRLGLPVTNPKTLEDYLLPLAGYVLRGGQSAYLWVPDAVPVVPNLRLEFDASDAVVVTLDQVVSVLLPIRERESTDATLDIAPGVAARVGGPVILGIRAPTMLFLTEEDDDDIAQVTVEPYVRGGFGAGFVSARFQYMVDEPFGPSFEDDKVWNAGIAGGLAF